MQPNSLLNVTRPSDFQASIQLSAHEFNIPEGCILYNAVVQAMLMQVV